MKLKLLENRFSVCKLKNKDDINWDDEYLFVGKTDEELSVVCSTEYASDNCFEREDGWRGFRIEGVLEFSMIGIMAKMSSLMAENSIGIFVVSTFNTDYILVKEDKIAQVETLLLDAGYEWV